MANTTKMTNKIALTTALNYVPETETEVREKITNMIAQLDKKNASPKKLTEKQVENKSLCSDIYDYLLADGGKHTVSDIIKNVPSLEGKSNQHVSQLMRQLKDNGLVDKAIEKRRSYFYALTPDAE